MADQAPEQPAAVPPRKDPKEGGIPWRMIAFGVLGAYGLLLVILNSQEVRVRFVFWSTRASLVILLLIVLAVGFLAGFLFDTARDRRKKRGRASQTS